MNINHYVFAGALMLLASSVFWVISLLRKDVSVVDSLWSLFFVIAASYFVLEMESISDRAKWIWLLVTVWGLRLSAYITIRHWGHKEDPRYQAIRAKNSPGFEFKSLYLIFVFQAVVAWIISMPIFWGMKTGSPMNSLDYVGVVLWMIGMFFEVVSDYQLWRFKQDESNRGKLLTTGLWKYTRHPNYFGESLIWWGFFCIALNSGQYWIVISPVMMTFLLLKFSGVALLESTMKSRPGYEAYMEQTNAFIPGLPRRGEA